VSKVWSWIVLNREWIFSGIGIFILGLVIALLQRRKKSSAGDIIVTHGNQSPSYVTGDFTVNQTIVNQCREAKKKQWRRLDEIDYLVLLDNEDRRMKYAGQLALHLHRAFKDVGYTQFASLLCLRQVKVNKDPTPLYCLVSHQAKFTGVLRRSWKYLWNPAVPAKSRQRYQDDLNIEFSTLYESWSFDLRLPFVERLIACEFTYDPDAHRISIGPPPIVSTRPSDYPDKVRTTSELLMYLSSVTGSPFIDFGDIACIKSYYPLFKLAIELIDNKGWRLDRIRINAVNCEEWDYINVAADIEVGRYSEPKDNGGA